MAMSMTGYGRHKEINSGYDISVEIKSVNHRYFDVNIRTPRCFLFLEEMVRKHLTTKINRGKIDLFIHMNNIEEADQAVSLNKAVAHNYLSVTKEMAQELSLPYDMSVSKMIKFSDVFYTDYKTYDEQEIFSILFPVLEKAIADFLDMRRKEGERLLADMLSRIEVLKGLTDQLEILLPVSIKEYEIRLREKMNEYISGPNFDENRILTEIAIFSDKVATFEETTRLNSHFTEFISLATQDKPIGKKLDFIIQEMNREINTTCSKCQSYEISKIGIDAKTEIEAMREQVQNLE